MLSVSINNTKDEISETNKQILECESKLGEQSEVLDKLDYYYNQFVSWADEYENASGEQKKMVICQLIKEVKVGRGYEIEIEFNASYKQFFEDNYSVEKKII